MLPNKRADVWAGVQAGRNADEQSHWPCQRERVMERKTRAAKT